MRHRTFLKFAVVAAWVTSLNLQAEVKLPAVFSDNMVLQQQSDARFWGWAAPGEQVEVKGSWEKNFSAAATAGEGGK